MKTTSSAIKSLLAAALAASCLASYAAAPRKREMKFEKLRKEFADPPRAFRPAPLWVWNTRVTRADIDRMLGDFKAQGFGGAFVHPRPGLVTEYLSDEWFDLYKYSVEKGKELGLDIWIYDENSYPSGFAGGHVPAQMPESYDQGQGLALTKTALPPADAGKYFLCLKKEGGTFRDITADTGRYKDVPGEYYLYEKTYYGRSGWHGGYSYVDLLVEGVTEKFLDITMSGYEKTFGNELARSSGGFSPTNRAFPVRAACAGRPTCSMCSANSGATTWQLRCPCSPSRRATGNRYATTTSKR